MPSVAVNDYRWYAGRKAVQLFDIAVIQRSPPASEHFPFVSECCGAVHMSLIIVPVRLKVLVAGS